MWPHQSRTRSRLAGGALLLALAFSVAACDGGPTGPEGAEGTAVVAGRVMTGGGPAATSGAAGPSSAQAGFVVEVEGSAVVDTTDANGTFRLEVPAGEDPLRIHFRKGGFDATVTLEGLPAGTILSIQVEVGSNGARVDHSHDGEHDDMEGYASLLSVSGAAPTRTMTLELREEGRTLEVLVGEESTAFSARGDLTDFDALLDALERGVRVEVEVDGQMGSDGRVEAVRLEAETDDHEERENEFEGRAGFVSITGDAPERVLRLEVDGEGPSVMVDLREGVTVIDHEGDFASFADVLAATRNGIALDVEGYGDLQDDGSLLAEGIKVETDD